MTADRPTEPSTEAGRRLLEDNGPHVETGEHSMLTRILAIEAEAAQGAAPPDHTVIERLDRPGNRANLEGPTDEERLAFKRSEHKAAAAIMAGDRYCPDPSAHEGAAPRPAEGPLTVEALAEAIHWHYCEDTPLNACGHTAAHRQLADRLMELMP